MAEGMALAARKQREEQRGWRRILWPCAGAWALFVATLVVGNLWIDSDKAVTRAGLGHDFLAFYTAGHFVRAGEGEKVYDLAAVRAFQRKTAKAAGLEWDDSPGMVAPFWNPPFYAGVFVPLSGMSFHQALGTWWIINGVCLLGALAVMGAMLPREATRRDKALLGVLVVLSMPAIQAVAHGQNTCVSLLLLSAAVWLWRTAARTRGTWMAFSAGAVCGLLAYKPQLGAVVGGMMVLTLRWRALVGGVASGAVLLAGTAVLMPGMIGEYAEHVGPNLRWMQMEQSYLWERHATLRGFWRLLIQHHATGETTTAVTTLWIVSVMGLVAALLSLVYRLRRRTPRGAYSMAAGEDGARQMDRLIAATVVCMPLLMPFYFDYDLLLLAVPAALLAGEMMAGVPERRGDRWLVGAWMVLYAALVLSPLVSGKLGVHVGVMVLCCTALLHVGRACRREKVTLVRLTPRSQAPDEGPMAAAA